MIERNRTPIALKANNERFNPSIKPHSYHSPVNVTCPFNPSTFNRNHDIVCNKANDPV